MRQLKTWAIVAFVALLVSETSYALFYDSDGGIKLGFLADPLMLFVYIGNYLGLIGAILWLGRMSPLSNKVAAFAFLVGIASCFLQSWLSETEVHISTLILTLFWAIGIATFFAFLSTLLQIIKKRDVGVFARNFCRSYILLTIIMISLGVAKYDILEISNLVLPLTIDADLYKIDTAFGGFASWLYIAFARNTFPLWNMLVASVYTLLNIMLLLSLITVLRERRAAQLNIFRVLVVPFMLPFALYILTPVAGPPAYGAHYPHNMDFVLVAAKGMTEVVPSVRNGMPSMHFTGAMLIVLVMACLTRKNLFLRCLRLCRHYFHRHHGPRRTLPARPDCRRAVLHRPRHRPAQPARLAILAAAAFGGHARCSLSLGN